MKANSICEPETIGVDTSRADGVDGIFLGRAFGQVFLARDTLLRSVTVWRPAWSGTNATPIRLYITGTWEHPYSLAPDVNQILLVGDALNAPHPSETPVPVRWEFDPPFALPQLGYFAFAVKEDSPACGGIFSFLVDSLETYEDGVAGRMSPTIDCSLGGGVSARPWDLVFTLEFCTRPVQAREETWGQIKAIYR